MPKISKSEPAQPLGITSAARTLSKSETTVRRLADKGLIPCIRDSAGRRLFTHADIVAYRNQQKK